MSVEAVAESVEARVARVAGLLAQSERHDYIGEGVSQLAHALQSADLARAAGAPDHEVLAALLHDIGHLCDPDAPRMADVGVARHEDVGADFLGGLGFSENVTALVAGHVAAKRYLVSTRPEYRDRLSSASKHTLEHQGGEMSPAERAAFEDDPLFEAKLRVRSWDEQAKVAGRAVDGIDAYRPLLEAHLRRETA